MSEASKQGKQEKDFLSRREFNRLGVFFVASLLVACGPGEIFPEVTEEAVPTAVDPSAGPTESSLSTQETVIEATATPTESGLLTEEMQDMGLRLEKDEDGRTTAVDERGYMRFYENEDGEWVDYYQELIYGTTMSFWDPEGEFHLPDGVDGRRMWISPVFTGEYEEFSMVMDGVDVDILSLVAVIADPLNSTIIREVRVPIQYSLPDGEPDNGPLIYTNGNRFLDNVDYLLNTLQAGDQFSVDIYTRVFVRHPVCKLDHICGPPLIINESQGATGLFTQVFDDFDSSSWPERLIVSALQVKLYPQDE
jgi:hypothetical protein